LSLTVVFDEKNLALFKAHWLDLIRFNDNSVVAYYLGAALYGYQKNCYFWFYDLSQYRALVVYDANAIPLAVDFVFNFICVNRSTYWQMTLDRPRNCTWWPKKLAHFFVCLSFIRLNFIKYWPIFKLISSPESGKH